MEDGVKGLKGPPGPKAQLAPLADKFYSHKNNNKKQNKNITELKNNFQTIFLHKSFLSFTKNK